MAATKAALSVERKAISHETAPAVVGVAAEERDVSSVGKRGTCPGSVPMVTRKREDSH